MPKLFLFFLLAPFVLHANVITVQLNVDQTGIDECITRINFYEEHSQIKLYPNPVDGILSVTFFEAEVNMEVHISIYNLLGEMVYYDSHQNADSRVELDINLEDQSPGIYFIQIQQANKHYNSKIILN